MAYHKGKEKAYAKHEYTGIQQGGPPADGVHAYAEGKHEYGSTCGKTSKQYCEGDGLPPHKPAINYREQSLTEANICARSDNQNIHQEKWYVGFNALDEDESKACQQATNDY